MTSQEKRLAKKRGRPATGRGTTIGVRCQDEMLVAVDEWRRRQPDIPTRATAIRRLAEIGLTATPKQKRGTRSIPVSKLNARNDT